MLWPVRGQYWDKPPDWVFKADIAGQRLLLPGAGRLLVHLRRLGLGKTQGASHLEGSCAQIPVNAVRKVT